MRGGQNCVQSYQGDYYHFMYYRRIPLFSSLTLTGLIGGLWWYALESTASTPTWVPASVLVIAFLIATIGMACASKTTGSKGAKITYLTGTVLFPTYHYKHFWVYSGYCGFNSRKSSRGLPLPGQFSAKVKTMYSAV